MKTLRFLAICAIALFCNLPLWAGDVVDPNGGKLISGSAEPTITFTTNHFGDVIVRLNETTKAQKPYFRSTMVASGIGGFQVNGGSASTYFDLDYAYNQQFFTLKKKDNVTVPEDAIIYLNDKDVYFICKENTSAQKQAKITYIYGTVWGTLASANPVINSFNTETGQITFDPIDGANSYVATVYLGRYKAYEQPITSGGYVTFGAYTDGKYEVTLKAVAANGDESKESAGVEWSLTGDEKYLPQSPVYQQMIINPQAGGDYLKTTALITFVTDKQTGVMTITMSETDGDAAGTALFHGSTALEQAGLKYDGKPIGDYFTRSVPGSNDNNADGKPQIVYTPNKTGNVPEYGKMITFNCFGENQAFRWRTGRKNNTDNQYMRFEYIYGTDATAPVPEEQKPHDLAIDEDKKLTFTGVDDVDSYKAEIYLNGDLVWTENNVLPTGTTIAFQAYVTATFKVYVKAIKGGNVTATSDVYDWELTQEPGVNPPSEYCAAPFTHVNGNLTSNIILTWETTEDGDVIISIGDGENTTGTHFRGNGMGDANLTEWKVRSGEDWATIENASNYFTRECTNNQFILRLKDDVTLPSPARIYTPKPIEWYSFNNNQFNVTPQGGLTYTYGGVCKQLGIVIAEDKDNTATIAMYDGRTSDVTLNRTFARDGYNYTLCLPFDMTAEQCVEAFGAGYKLYLLGNAYMKSDDMMYLPFNEVHAIEAGKPYIFCPAADVVNPTIEGVTINAAAPVAYPVVQGGALATMTGIYSPAVVAASNYVLGEENWLYQSNGDEMKGLRCYFTLTPSAATSNVRARAVFHNTDVVTDLETIDGSQCTMHDGKYVINGKFFIIRNNARYNGMGQQVK